MVPHLLSQGAGRGAWIAALIGILVELGLVFLALLIIERGKPIFKVLIPIMFLVFLFHILITANSSFQLINDHLFFGINVQKVLIPLALFGICFCFLQNRALFRSGEIFYWIIIIALVLSIAPSLTSIRFNEIYPVEKSISIFETAFMNIIYFESAFFILLFSGSVDTGKNFKRRFMISASVLSIIFVFFIALMTGVFGMLAPFKESGIIDLTAASSFLAGAGRMDFLLICVWLLVILLRFGAAFYFAYTCIIKTISLKKFKYIPAIVLGVGVWVMITFMPMIQNIWIAGAVFTLILIVSILAFVSSKKREIKDG